MADRLAFLQAKKKELESFFQNQVWVYDDKKNAPADRVLKPHFLNWKKNPDGTPGAKARLITQGFKDPGCSEWIPDDKCANFDKIVPQHDFVYVCCYRGGNVSAAQCGPWF